MLTVTDEDQRLQAVNVVLSIGTDDTVKILADNLAQPKPRHVDEPPASAADSDDDEVIAEVDPATLPTKVLKRKADDLAAKEEETRIAGKKRPHPDDEPASSEIDGVVTEAATPEKKQRTLPNDGSNAQAPIELD